MVCHRWCSSVPASVLGWFRERKERKRGEKRRGERDRERWRAGGGGPGHRWCGLVEGKEIGRGRQSTGKDDVLHWPVERGREEEVKRESGSRERGAEHGARARSSGLGEMLFAGGHGRPFIGVGMAVARKIFNGRDNPQGR